MGDHSRLGRMEAVATNTVKSQKYDLKGLHIFGGGVSISENVSKLLLQ